MFTAHNREWLKNSSILNKTNKNKLKTKHWKIFYDEKELECMAEPPGKLWQAARLKERCWQDMVVNGRARRMYLDYSECRVDLLTGIARALS